MVMLASIMGRRHGNNSPAEQRQAVQAPAGRALCVELLDGACPLDLQGGCRSPVAVLEWLVKELP
jgi:hypothetical protein